MPRSAAILAVLLAAAPGTALAGEEEWLLSVEGGWGLLSTPATGDLHGGGPAIDLWIGVTEATWLFVTGGTRFFEGGAPLMVETLGGIAAAFDVLRTVPFIEAGAGVTIQDGALTPLLRVGVGADYLITPNFAIGAVVRYRPLFLSGSSDRMASADLRLSWRADF